VKQFTIFEVSSIETFYGGESPVHEVVLSGYRISRYPITVGQYRRFLEDDEGYQDRRWWKAGGFGKYTEPENWQEQIEYPSRPVVGVSWWEAAAFCAWSGYRLPTEAERGWCTGASRCMNKTASIYGIQVLRRANPEQ